MRGFKSPALWLAWILIIPSVKAQDYHNAWFRTTLSYPVTQKIRVDGEIQHRRQSGFGNRDCLDTDLMYTLRSWIHYQHNESVRFSLSPFAYFSHHRIIQEPGDAEADPVREYRISAALDLQHEIFRKFHITNRSAVEYRMLSNVGSPVTRVRNRLGVRYDLTPKIKAALYEEFFFNVSGTTLYYFFDHNRKAVQVEYAFLPRVKLEAGYVYIRRLPPGNVKKIRENNLFLNLTIQLKGRLRPV